ncbi:MAG: 2Fe-2S iron-sulfur cluster-binding protein [Ilumatobacter sp.]
MTSQLTVRVARRERVARDIDAFELVMADGSSLPSVTAGAHVDVHIPGGCIRQYSLANDPADAGRYVIGVLNDPASRGGSAAMHARVKEGDLLTISAPKNHFPLAQDASHSVLLAGGIGVTPMLAMAEQLVSSGASFELHYSTRSTERTAFRERLAGERFAGRIRHHFDDGDPDQHLDLDALLSLDEPGTHLYVCGPTGFMEWVLSSARDARWPEERLHFEFFSAAAVDPADHGGFEVQIASSGAVVQVGAEQTVVAALSDHGIAIPMSCEQGVCGTCLVGVLEGEPDHNDLFLMPKEQAANDRFLPCISRARSDRLVLDL